MRPAMLLFAGLMVSAATGYNIVSNNNNNNAEQEDDSSADSSTTINNNNNKEALIQRALALDQQLITVAPNMRTHPASGRLERPSQLVQPSSRSYQQQQQQSRGKTATDPQQPAIDSSSLMPAHHHRHQIVPPAATMRRHSRLRSSTVAVESGDGGATTWPASESSADEALSRMYLDVANMALDVQARVGSTAYLVCRLRAHQFAELQVSWVRNMQILTAGELRYTSDERFRPAHLTGTPEWALEIRNVRPEDSGSYECQVNSEPRPARLGVRLRVADTRLHIIEGPLVSIDLGAPIRLTCRVQFVPAVRLSSQSEEPSLIINNQDHDGDHDDDDNDDTQMDDQNVRPSGQHYVYWYKDDASLEYNNPRGGIHVERRELKRGLKSELTIDGATSADSGTYACRLLPELADSKPARAVVQVGGAKSGASNASLWSLASCYFAIVLSSTGILASRLLCQASLACPKAMRIH